MKIAVCPGSFDPITNGHLDIIKRAAVLFDKVIILISNNMDKKYMFSVEERVQFVLDVTANISNVEVDHFDGLLSAYVKKRGACAIVKGLRAMSDFEYEFQMALANRMLNETAETIFLSASSEYMYFSSSLVKQIGSLGGDISNLVPKEILEETIRKLSHGGAKE